MLFQVRTGRRFAWNALLLPKPLQTAGIRSADLIYINYDNMLEGLLPYMVALDTKVRAAGTHPLVGVKATAATQPNQGFKAHTCHCKHHSGGEWRPN